MINQTPLEEIRKTISKILIKWGMPTRQVAINEIAQQIAKAERRMAEEYTSKINMMLLGIKTFKEFEKQRPIDEAKGVICRDGGPTMKAFGFINRLEKELFNLTPTTGEKGGL